MHSSLKGLRPLPRAMQNGENVNRVFQDAISDDVGRSRYDYLARATDAAHSSGIGHPGSLTDGEPNALDRPEGRAAIIVRDVVEDFPELLDRGKGPP